MLSTTATSSRSQKTRWSSKVNTTPPRGSGSGVNPAQASPNGFATTTPTLISNPATNGGTVTSSKRSSTWRISILVTRYSSTTSNSGQTSTTPAERPRDHRHSSTTPPSSSPASTTPLKSAGTKKTTRRSPDASTLDTSSTTLSTQTL